MHAQDRVGDIMVRVNSSGIQNCNYLGSDCSSDLTHKKLFSEDTFVCPQVVAQIHPNDPFQAKQFGGPDSQQHIIGHILSGKNDLAFQDFSQLYKDRRQFTENIIFLVEKNNYKQAITALMSVVNSYRNNENADLYSTQINQFEEHLKQLGQIVSKNSPQTKRELLAELKDAAQFYSYCEQQHKI